MHATRSAVRLQGYLTPAEADCTATNLYGTDEQPSLVGAVLCSSALFVVRHLVPVPQLAVDGITLQRQQGIGDNPLHTTINTRLILDTTDHDVDL